MITIEIIKCSGENYWYKNRIGEYFHVKEDVRYTNEYDFNTKTFKIKKSKKFDVIGSIKKIDMCDCKIISVSDKIERIKKRLNEQ